MEFTELLKKLISIPSVFPHEQEMSEFLTKYLQTLGFDIKHVLTSKNRNNIIARFGKANTYLGLYGHMDTVPPDPGYMHDPYSMWIENDYIARGLGVCDMKGGIAAILKTAEYAAKNHQPIKIIFGVDEEDISQGAHDLCDSGLLNDVKYLIVAESGQVKDVHQDFSVVYGRKGRIVFDMEVKGRSAHAAESEKGVNAIEQAAKLVQMLHALTFPQHQTLGQTNIVVQKIEAESGSFSVPDSCKLRCSVLTNPMTTSQMVIDHIQTLAQSQAINMQIELSPRLTPYGESYETPLNHPFSQKIEKEVLHQYNVTPIYTASVADENVFANRLQIPVMTIGPIGGGDHTKDEWVNLRSLEHVTAAFIQILDLH